MSRKVTSTLRSEQNSRSTRTIWRPAPKAGLLPVWEAFTESDPTFGAQLRDETPMKSASFASCAVLVLLLAVPWLGAQSKWQASAKITVDVPFDFMIGQAMFPTGNYIITPVGNRTFRLQATHGRASVKFATRPTSIAPHPDTTRLIFLQENRHYQLRELWMNADTGARIPGPQVEQLRDSRESRVEVPAICTGCN